MRFALEHQNPFVTGGIVGTDSSPYPADSYSLVKITDPDVLLWAVKPAEEGIDKGVVVRMWNMAATPRNYGITLAGGISAAQRITHIETDIASLPVTGSQVKAAIFQSQIQTLRLMPAQVKP